MDTKRRKRNAQLTRTAVLAAAEKLFAQHGFWGVSMRDLSRACGVSQPLIHHHFGTKEALYQEVKKNALERFRSVKPAEKAALPAVRSAIENIFAHMVDNRNLLRMTSWSRLEDDGLWPGEAEMMKEFSDGLAEAQKRGLIRKGTDPLMATIMIASLVCFWCEERTRYRKLMGHGADMDKRYLDAMFDMLQSGIFTEAKCSRLK